MTKDKITEIEAVTPWGLYQRMCTLGDYLHNLEPANRYELTGKIIHAIAGGQLKIELRELAYYGIVDVMEVSNLIGFLQCLTHALKYPQTIYKMVYTVARLLISPWAYGIADHPGIANRHIIRILVEEEELTGLKFQMFEPREVKA